MHRRPLRRALTAARVAVLVSTAAAVAPAQQFGELVGRGLPRGFEDTAAVELCDVDGDGHVDLLVGALDLFPGPPLQLRIGSADGVFVAAPAGWMPARRCLPAALVCADFDGDGDRDVFIANRDFVQNALYVNDGSGRFTDVTSLRVPASSDDSRAAAAADVDGDSDLDLVVANALGPDLLLLNDGAGTFSIGPALPDLPSDDPTSVAFVDADGDQIIDLVVGNARGQNRFWSNDGAGGFTDLTAAALPVDVDVTTSIAVADVDGDGAPDFIAGNRGTPDRLYRNNGSGRFLTDPTWMPPAGGQTIALATLDADADGDPDVVAGRFGEVNVLLLNDGTGSFRAAPAPWPEQADHTNAVAVADVDGDGDSDMVHGNGRSMFAPGRQQLLLNDGTGAFVCATTVSWPAPDADSHALVVCDLDGDGAVDVVVAADSTVETWLGDGYGGFGARAIVATGVSPDFVQALACGDVDGDGDPDVVVGTSSSNVLLSNDGAGRLAAAPGVLPPGGFDTRAIALVDVDGDGDLDVVEGNAGSSPQFAQQNRLLVNDGSGRFVDDTANLLPARPDFTFAIATSDVDRDGDVDLLFGNWSVIVPTAPRQPNTLLLNDGTGRFGIAPGRLPVDDDPTAAIAFGDLDGDGDDDIVTGNMRARNRVYRNDGAGTFSEDLTALPNRAEATHAVVLADYDADGDVDLFFGNDEFRNVVLRNDGPSAGFVDLSGSAWDSFRGGTRDMALVDVDQDDDLDVLVANRAGQTDRLLFGLTRHLDIPCLIRSGRTFTVEAYARPAVAGTQAHLWLALSDAPPLLLPPLGALRLNPNRLFDLGEAAVSVATGRGDFRFSVPVAPAMVGTQLFFQSLLYSPAALADARLTNILRRVISD